RLINKVMKNGEKRKARNIVYEAAQIIEKKSSLPFLTVFEGARTNAKPGLELKSEIIFDACHNKGGAIQKKEAIQKKGEENKAFAVFLNRSAK
ncbi:11032_t:CDS:2, partial [Racocetra persica]